MSAVYDFVNTNTVRRALEQGATFDRTFTADIGGTPINFTGYTARMKVRANASATAIIDLTTTNGGIVLGGALGTIQLLMTASATALLVPGMYKYDLELVSGSTVTRYLEGKFEVTAEMTK